MMLLALRVEHLQSSYSLFQGVKKNEKDKHDEFGVVRNKGCGWGEAITPAGLFLVVDYFGDERIAIKKPLLQRLGRKKLSQKLVAIIKQTKPAVVKTYTDNGILKLDINDLRSWVEKIKLYL